MFNGVSDGLCVPWGVINVGYKSLDDPTMECFVMEVDHEPDRGSPKAAIHGYTMM